MENLSARITNFSEKKNERYFEQEKEYINSGHKDFPINFERKQIPVKYSVKLVKELTGHEKPKLETKESGPSELNILNFKNDSRKRKDFYKSSKFNGDILEDDAIILEGSLKHLKIIQDSLSDKLPKIIHYEIFHSIKIFVDQELINALMAEWKQNTMSSKYHVFK